MASFLVILQVLRVLAIGNSFSVDALEQEFVPECAKAGITPIVGNLYIGGCSLERHAQNIQSNAQAYSYRTYTTKWDTVQASVREALLSDKWDVVTVQQASHYSGEIETYEPYLTMLIDTIRALCPTAKIAWHQTWAYTPDSKHPEYGRYHHDQAYMYKMICACTKTVMKTHPEIDVLIPTGKAVQKARKKNPTDQLCRDGYHLSYESGRPLAAKTWVKTLRKYAKKAKK